MQRKIIEEFSNVGKARNRDWKYHFTFILCYFSYFHKQNYKIDKNDVHNRVIFITFSLEYLPFSVAKVDGSGVSISAFPSPLSVPFCKFDIMTRSVLKKANFLSFDGIDLSDRNSKIAK